MSGVEFPLRLVLAPGAARAPVAWVLPGDDPAAWLEDLATLAEALGAPAASFDLWLVPEVGLLARAPGAPGAEVRSRAQPYGALAGRLLVPVDGALAPEVTAAELDQALAPGQHLLHPSAGLVRLAPEARLGVADLLAPPLEVVGAWRSLEPPTAPLRLASIEVEPPPSLEEWLREGAAGVAEAPPSQAPPAPDEKDQGGAGAWLGQQAARFVQWAARSSGKEKESQEKEQRKQEKEQQEKAQQQPSKQESPGASGEGVLDRLLRWSEETLANVKDARQRELDRLLHLLDDDPDEGLRYALPLTGDGSGGPPAPPGAKLPPRSVDYGAAGRTTRGSSADPWEIDHERHRRLVERYRALASRELRLGRFRRAAYVFAELLGDLGAAASALEQGRHFREAAALYKDRLARPLEAARCLERGGLLAEAAALYEAEARWVEAGDVWSRLARGDDARRAYRRAVEVRLELDDPLSAARLLETKLDAADEALEVLAATWPAHPQAGPALEDRLGLLARAARHEAARGLLDDLRQDPRREGHALVLARALGGVAARYPEAGVQARARDLARVVSGERLSRRPGPGPGPDEAEALLQVLSRLDPTDRLLGRDVGRMSAQLRREAAKALVARPVVRGEGWTARVVREKRLLGPVWRAIEPSGDVIWSLHSRQDGRALHLQRERWSPGAAQEVSWAWSSAGEKVLFAAPDPTRRLAIVLSGGRPQPRRLLPAYFEEPPCEAGGPGWCDGQRRVHALACDDQGLTWSLQEGGPGEPGLVLACHDAQDRLLGTCTVVGSRSDGDRDDVVGWLEEAETEAARLRVTRGGRAVAVVGRRLISFRGTEPVAHRELSRPAYDLALLERPFTTAVSRDDGGRLYFMDDEREPLSFAEGLLAPGLAFTSDGLLVAVTKDEGRVYLVHAGRVEHKGTFAGPGADVLCVRPTDRPRSVVVVTTDGTVRELEFTRS